MWLIRQPNDAFHFSFLIWDNKGRNGIIPLVVGQLKKPQNKEDCILIGWGWNVDKTNDHVRDVINDPEKTSRLVKSPKTVVDPEKYLISFLPNEQSVDVIKVSYVYPIDWLDKQSYEKK